MSLTVSEQAAEKVFAGLGGEVSDPPAVMPAALPLELSGEAVRARLCVFSDHEGAEQALRPDLTLPVAAEEAARRSGGDGGERIVRYAARAYRLPADRGSPVEFTQVGFERFGAASSPEADADVFRLVSEAAVAAGAREGHAWFGDLAIFPAFVDALGLPESMAGAVKRAFRQAGGVRALLDGEGVGAPTGLAARLKGASWDEAEAIVQDVLELSGAPLIGARTLPEIVERLLAKAADAEAGGVPDEAHATLDAVLDVEASPAEAVAALTEIADSSGARAALPAIERLATRMAAIEKTAPQFLSGARFGTPFGRRFNYYDGFVFELFAPNAPETRPFGAGGRYDTLLSRLSEDTVEATAIGGVLRADRIGGGA